MIPFPMRLKAVRESRGMLQKSLAIAIDVAPIYLSALERGRKDPPQNPDFFDKLQIAWDLSSHEIEDLKNLAAATETIGQLANGSTPMQVEVAMKFARLLHKIPPGQLRVIDSVLENIAT